MDRNIWNKFYEVTAGYNIIFKAFVQLEPIDVPGI